MVNSAETQMRPVKSDFSRRWIKGGLLISAQYVKWMLMDHTHMCNRQNTLQFASSSSIHTHTHTTESQPPDALYVPAGGGR